MRLNTGQEGDVAIFSGQYYIRLQADSCDGLMDQVSEPFMVQGVQPATPTPTKEGTKIGKLMISNLTIIGVMAIGFVIGVIVCLGIRQYRIHKRFSDPEMALLPNPNVMFKP